MVPAMISTTIMVAVKAITNQVRRSLRSWLSPRKTCSCCRVCKEGPCIGFTFGACLRRSGGSLEVGADHVDQFLGTAGTVGIRLAGGINHMMPDMLLHQLRRQAVHRPPHRGDE